MVAFDLILLLVAIGKFKKRAQGRKSGVFLFFVGMFALINIFVATGYLKATTTGVVNIDPRIIAIIGIAIDALTVFLTFMAKGKVKDQDKTDLATKLYKVCLENGIKGCDTEEEQKGICLVAKNLGIAEKNAVAMYKKGIGGFKDEQIRIQQDEEKKEMDEKKNDIIYAERIMEKNIKKNSMQGKGKYLQPYQEILKDVQRSLAGASESVKQIERMGNAMYREHNSSIAGGLAQGIAGVGAGLAAYARTEQENAAKREAKARFTQAANKGNISQERKYKERVEKLSKFIPWYSKWLEGVMIDEVDNSLYSHVQLTIVGREEFINSGYMILLVKSELDEDHFSVLNQTAKLDGNICVEVYEQGRKVGAGYYSPFGYGATDLSRIGFGYEFERRVMIKPEAGIELKLDKTYEYKFVPEKLWLVQAKDIGEDKREEYKINKFSTQDWVDWDRNRK